MSEIPAFLRAVITPLPKDYEGKAYVNLSTADKDVTKSSWREYYYEWPNELEKLAADAARFATSLNVYFTAHLFSQRDSKREYVLPTRTIQIDLDEADIHNLPVQPIRLLRTSPDRHLAFVMLSDKADDAVPLDEVENYSKILAYNIPRADMCWKLGHRVRLPFTTNFKYPSCPQVEVVGQSTHKLDPASLDSLSIPNNKHIINDEDALDWVDLPHKDEPNIPPVKIIKQLFDAGEISHGSYLAYNIKMPDRSAAQWKLMKELFEAGANRDQVYWLASQSDNNKFEHARDLRKDVLRAEMDFRNNQNDLKELLQNILKDVKLGSREQRMLDVSSKVIRDMLDLGKLITDTDESVWYVLKDTGKPMDITSPHFLIYLTYKYGLNASTHSSRFAREEIKGYASQIPNRTEVTSLGYYDESGSSVMIHSGGKDVYIITPDDISVTSNGSLSNVLFANRSVVETFRRDELALSAMNGTPWYKFLFKDCLHTVLNMDRDEAVALLSVLIIYLLVRNTVTTWPLLLNIGEPGSGKSVLNRVQYRLLYGKMRNLQSIGDVNEFDLITSISPFVVIDNVEEKIGWLESRLATSIGGGERIRRQLYTDKGIVALKREALVSITSMAPQFVRVDVLDRSLTLQHHRLPEFISEARILNNILKHRNALWTGIMHTVQNLLRTPRPTDGIPQFRIQDFADIGYWIATSMNLTDEFKGALSKAEDSQRGLAIEDNYVLVEALKRWARRNPNASFISTGQLYNELTSRPTTHGVTTNIVHQPYVDDLDSFKKSIPNAVKLGIKLNINLSILRHVLNIEQGSVGVGSNKTGWRIRIKDA